MLLFGAGMVSCAAKASDKRGGDHSLSGSEAEEVPVATRGVFDADSAYEYIVHQVGFGPRVPNSEAHRRAGEWIAGELKSRGAEVTLQKVGLRAFDGTILSSTNILGRFNPEAEERLLILAHWDCRPWADEDADISRRNQPVDGANDGASGAGVMLEIARQLSIEAPSKGVDLLFVDAEDWGRDGDDESWAMGARYFARNLPIKNYSPAEGILLDMVGGKGARFPREYFSEQSVPGLNNSLWSIASELGYGSIFPNKVESAVTDDHIPLIEAGIPTVDIIEYHPHSGFNSRWHTTSDNMEGISRTTLRSVGETVMTYIRRKY